MCMSICTWLQGPNFCMYIATDGSKPIDPCLAAHLQVATWATAW